MAVKFQDYYETLGVARTASQDEIKRAFRVLARKYHPDYNKTSEADAKMKQINEAYEVLKDPEKRQKYDELGANYKSGQEFRPPPGYEGFGGAGGTGAGGFRMDGGSFSDFFEAFFGAQGSRGPMGGGGRAARGRQRAQAGADVEAQIHITLDDAYRGTTRGIKLQTAEGVKSYDVKIPPGTTDGSVIRLTGQGQPGIGGGPAGNLRLKVHIARHPLYEVQGQDLITDVKLAPWEAALGAKVDVPTLDGIVTLTVPPGAQSGQKMRLRGKGMPARGKSSDGEGGDLFVRFQIVVPKELSDEEREAFEKLKEVSKFNPRE